MLNSCFASRRRKTADVRGGDHWDRNQATVVFFPNFQMDAFINKKRVFQVTP